MFLFDQHRSRGSSRKDAGLGYLRSMSPVLPKDEIQIWFYRQIFAVMFSITHTITCIKVLFVLPKVLWGYLWHMLILFFFLSSYSAEAAWWKESFAEIRLEWALGPALSLTYCASWETDMGSPGPGFLICKTSVALNLNWLCLPHSEINFHSILFAILKWKS